MFNLLKLKHQRKKKSRGDEILFTLKTTDEKTSCLSAT